MSITQLDPVILSSLRLRVRRSNFMRSKFNFFMRSNFWSWGQNSICSWGQICSLIFHSFDQEVEFSIMRSKFKKALLGILISWSMLVTSMIMRLKFKKNYLNLVSCTCGFFFALILSHLCIKTFDVSHKNNHEIKILKSIIIIRQFGSHDQKFDLLIKTVKTI